MCYCVGGGPPAEGRVGQYHEHYVNFLKVVLRAPDCHQRIAEMSGECQGESNYPADNSTSALPTTDPAAAFTWLLRNLKIDSYPDPLIARNIHGNRQFTEHVRYLRIEFRTDGKTARPLFSGTACGSSAT